MDDPAIGTREYGKREELAWAAGFFDGEGSVGCYKNSRPGVRARRWSVTIQQKTPPVLHRFQMAVGGLGQVGGPYKTKGRDIYTYRSCRFEHVQAIMAMLWVFLSEQKRADFKRSALAMKEVSRHRGRSSNRNS